MSQYVIHYERIYTGTVVVEARSRWEAESAWLNDPDFGDDESPVDYQLVREEPLAEPQKAI